MLLGYSEPEMCAGYWCALCMHVGKPCACLLACLQTPRTHCLRSSGRCAREDAEAVVQSFICALHMCATLHVSSSGQEYAFKQMFTGCARRSLVRPKSRPFLQRSACPCAYPGPATCSIAATAASVPSCSCSSSLLLVLLGAAVTQQGPRYAGAAQAAW